MPGTKRPKKIILRNRLKEVRAEKELWQQDLANMVGVSRETINEIEEGIFQPSAKLAFTLCIALDKKFEEVFYFAPPAPGSMKDR